MPRPRSDGARLSENALTVLRRRYLAKDPDGRLIETPHQLFRRVAHNLAQAEDLYPTSRGQRPRIARAFTELMSRLDFLPNSPTLMNAGRDLQQLSACFVLPVEDSLESIFEAVKHQALIHQSGGGTGFSFSHLRQKNDRVLSTSGIASGPVSFMRVFNMATEVVKQGGTRRGANMGILRVDHPDILEFIEVKQDRTELTNFNLSVALTDAFMAALDARRDFPLVHPRTGRVVRRVRAAAIFDRIVSCAWQTGEPGVIFLDTINRHHPTPHLGRIEATNPCSEQPLLPYESCNLGSLNLDHFVVPRRGRRPAGFDYDRVSAAVHLAVRLLDNVIDVNRYPLPEIAAITRGNRKIGLGVMGFADALIRLDVPYDSEEALTLGERLMRFIWEEGRAASADLARIRGSFPNYKGSRLEAEGQHLRNATVTTIAPTGTLSLIADCSPGIEPLYAVSLSRHVMEGVRLQSLHPEFVRRARAARVYSSTLVEKIGRSESIQQLTELPADLRRLFVTAHDITPEHHVRMQAAFQKFSDSGVSKTINLPPHATQADVASAFLLAYRLGCKGVTVFRSGSREEQVLACANVQYC